MTFVFSYIIKSSIILIILGLYYHLFLSKQTFFNLNRIYLLGSLITSVILPFISIPLFSEGIEKHELPAFIYYVSVFNQEINTLGTVDLSPNTNNSYSFLVWIYFTGVLFFLSRYIFGMFKICRLIIKSSFKRLKNIRITYGSDKYASFSFLNYIFINNTFLSREERKRILEHELIHVKHCHSIDITIAEFICILNWFNPLVWKYKKIIAQNHEYIADKKVITKYQTGRYMQLLLNQALQGDCLPLVNCFSNLNLKYRLIMMTKKPTNKRGILKYIPAFIIGIILCSGFSFVVPEISLGNFLKEVSISDREENNEMISESLSNTELRKEIINEIKDTIQDNSVHQIVEENPSFKENMNEWLRANLTYPEEAKNNGIQGRVYVQFIIEKDGKLSDVNIVKSVDPLLDAEALRVVKAMPAWNPGKQKGKAVRTQFTLPIVFSLQ